MDGRLAVIDRLSGKVVPLTVGVGRDRLADTAGWVRFARTALLGMSVAAAVIVWVTWYGGGTPSDASAFYNPTYGRVDFVYIWSPAFAQASAPLRLLPFDVFVGIVRAVELGAIVALAPYGAWIAIFLPPVAAEVNAANLNMALILCVVASVRYPWAWALPLLTKPSMGLALAWFGARGEWRKVAWAILPAAAIAAVSFVLDPAAWFTWIRMLTTFGDVPGWPFPIPIWPRIPIALAIAVLGRRHPWAMPLAAIIALPRMYFLSIAMLLGLLPMLRRDAKKPPHPKAGR